MNVMVQVRNVDTYLFQARMWLQYAAALGGRPYRMRLHDMHTGLPYWATFDARYCRETLRLDPDECWIRAKVALNMARIWNKNNRRNLV